MIDRKARNEVSHIINRYLNDELTAFELDDQLIGIATDDYTVSYVIYQMWFFYDDLKDHKVHLNKQAWDYIQRLLFVLHSNAEIKVTNHTRRRWTWENALAWVTLLSFSYFVFVLQGGNHHPWLLFGLLVSPVTLFIHWRRNKRRKANVANHVETYSDWQISCTPFSSVSDMLRLYRRTSCFKKQPHRREINNRNIRSKFSESLMKCCSAPLVLLLSPLILLFFGIPTREGEETHTLVIPE